MRPQGAEGSSHPASTLLACHCCFLLPRLLLRLLLSHECCHLVGHHHWHRESLGQSFQLAGLLAQHALPVCMRGAQGFRV